jgi:hypothetical protein
MILANTWVAEIGVSSLRVPQAEVVSSAVFEYFFLFERDTTFHTRVGQIQEKKYNIAHFNVNYIFICSEASMKCELPITQY